MTFYIHYWMPEADGAVGPFPTEDAASRYAKTVFGAYGWTVGTMEAPKPLPPPEETFSSMDVTHAIKDFLKLGKSTEGTGHQGYYSNSGWVARCLRWHLKQLEKEQQ